MATRASTGASSHLDWIATVVGRVGVTIDRALVYAGGGAAWTRENDSLNASATGVGIGFSWGGSNTPFGWTFLTGVEYMIDPHWSARLQYNYYDFGGQNVTLNPNDNPTTLEFGPDPISTELRIHSITAGVNYRF